MTRIFDNKYIADLDNYVDEIFNYYRKNGFPYFNLNSIERSVIFDKLVQFDSSNIVEGVVLKQYMLGLNLCNYYFPEMFSVKSPKMRTPIELFENDNLFKNAIRKRLNYGIISDASIRRMCTWTNGAYRVSNFRPTVSKYIYDNYSGDGVVLDPSSGYGGRLFGALASDKVKKYVGVEPNRRTIKGLTNIKNEFDFQNKSTIINDCFENVDYFSEIFDLVFTSPPYYNKEMYSNDKTQSYIKYPTKELWTSGFLRPFFVNSYNQLKKSGHLILNIANVNTYTDLEEVSLMLAKEVGFELIDVLSYRLSSMNKDKGKHKIEPCYIFRKTN